MGIFTRERFRQGAKRRLLGAHTRRLFLQVGLPWGAALLVGLISVLYSDWSTDASNAFLGWITGRSWLAFVITPALTVLALFLTRLWFTGSEGSGIMHGEVVGTFLNQVPQDAARATHPRQHRMQLLQRRQSHRTFRTIR